MKIALFAHGGSGNHGCEAIVRSTIGMLGSSGKEYCIFSERPDEDIRYGLDAIASISATLQPLPKGWRSIAYRIGMHLNHSDAYYYRYRYHDVAKKAEGFDLAISTGGDNYCYKGFAERFGVLHDRFLKAGVPTILWGCSIDPERLDETMVSELGKYQMITARESITYGALKEKGLKNVFQIPDTAFLLPSREPPHLQGISGDAFVGINLSPLIIRQERQPGITIENYRNLIRHILDHTSMGVMLIPHVVWADNDDREPLRQLHDIFRDTGRVAMVDDADAITLKGIISRCRFLVAARTHASIAGYSTGVPTIVTGYSVKSEGIAKDLFGTSENYVIPISSLSVSDTLTRGFEWLMNHEEEIREKYRNRLASYISQAERAKGLTEEIWKR